MSGQNIIILSIAIPFFQNLMALSSIIKTAHIISLVFINGGAKANCLMSFFEIIPFYKSLTY